VSAEKDYASGSAQVVVCETPTIVLYSQSRGTEVSTVTANEEIYVKVIDSSGDRIRAIRSIEVESMTGFGVDIALSDEVTTQAPARR